MPQVPRLGINQVDVSPGPRIQQSADAPLAAFGGGQGLSEAANAMGSIIQKEIEKADDLQLTEAKTKLNDFFNRRMYKDEDALVNQRGKNAFEFDKKFNDDFNKFKAEIEGSLSGGARNKFNALAESSKLSADDTVAKYMSQEKTKYEDDTYKGYLMSEIDTAANNYGDMMKVELSKQNVLDKTREYLTKFKGIAENDPQFGLLMKDAESGLHISVIDKMIDDEKDIVAEEYLKANVNQMNEKDRSRAIKLVEESSIKGTAQRATDMYMSKGYSVDKAYEMAQAEFGNNPKKREAVEQRIDQMYMRKERAERQGQQDLFDYAVKQFNATGEVPSKLIAAMKPETQLAFDSYKGRNPVLDDSSKYYELERMAADPKTRNKFMNYDLLKDVNRLSDSNFNKLVGLQRALLSGKGGAGKDAEDELNGIYTKQQLIEQRFNIAGQSKKDIKKFQQQVDDEVVKMQKDLGRKVNRQELNQIIDGKLKEQITDKGFFYDTKKPDYLITVDDIPSDTRDELESKMRFKNIPISDERLVKEYKRILNGL